MSLSAEEPLIVGLFCGARALSLFHLALQNEEQVAGLFPQKSHQLLGSFAARALSLFHLALQNEEQVAGLFPQKSHQL